MISYRKWHISERYFTSKFILHVMTLFFIYIYLYSYTYFHRKESTYDIQSIYDIPNPKGLDKRAWDNFFSWKCFCNIEMFCQFFLVLSNCSCWKKFKSKNENLNHFKRNHFDSRQFLLKISLKNSKIKTMNVKWDHNALFGQKCHFCLRLDLLKISGFSLQNASNF